MDIKTLKKVPIVDVLAHLGFHPSYYRKQNTDAWYLSPIRAEKSPSFHVSVLKNVWYDMGIGSGGDIIDLFLHLIPNLRGISDVLNWADGFFQVHSFSTAVTTETNVMLGGIEIISESTTITHPALLEYLASRNIEVNKLEGCAVEVHYKRGNNRYFSLAHKNQYGGYECRSTKFKACIGRKCVHWIVKSEHTVLSIFEGWSDYYAFLHLFPGKVLRGTVLILNSVSLLNSVLHLLDMYSKVYCFLDNDYAGSAATEKVAQYANVVDCRYKYNGYKDVAEWYEAFF